MYSARRLLTPIMTAVSLLTLGPNMLCAADAAALQDDNAPQPYIVPQAAMQKLAELQGQWSMVIEYSADEGETWSASPPQDVVVHFQQRNLLLTETPVEAKPDDFNLITNIMYDQYRGVFRKSVMDDTWGLMDIYEGHVEGNVLIMDNLRSDTSFPLPSGVQRHFRLSIDLKAENGVRRMTIDSSDDAGKTWMPRFKASYRNVPSPD